MVITRKNSQLNNLTNNDIVKVDFKEEFKISSLTSMLPSIDTNHNVFKV